MQLLLFLITLCQFSLDPQPVWDLAQPDNQKGGDPVSDSSPVVPSNTPTNAPVDAGAAGEVFHTIRIQQWGATWCPSCPGGKAQAQAAADKLGVKLEYFDYDKHKALAQQLGVSSVPRTFVVIDDMIAHRYVGQTSSATIVAKARELAGDGKPPQSRDEPVRERVNVPAKSLPTVTRTGNATSAGLTQQPIVMRWNFEGDWNPTTAEMLDHLAEHGVDATGMTRQEMAATHDRIHNGMTARAACPTCPTTTVQRQSGGRFFGLFR